MLDPHDHYPDMEHIPPGRDMFADHPIRMDALDDDADSDRLVIIREEWRRQYATTPRIGMKWRMTMPKQWKEKERKLLLEHLEHSVVLLQDTGNADDRALASVLNYMLMMHRCGGIQAMAIAHARGSERLLRTIVGEKSEDEQIKAGMEIVRRMLKEPTDAS